MPGPCWPCVGVRISRVCGMMVEAAPSVVEPLVMDKFRKTENNNLGCFFPSKV